MTLEITLAPEEEAKLREKAAAEHTDIVTFAREAVLRRINGPTLNELLGPIHAATERAGLTERDIDKLVEPGREAYWREISGL